MHDLFNYDHDVETRNLMEWLRGKLISDLESQPDGDDSPNSASRREILSVAVWLDIVSTTQVC